MNKKQMIDKLNEVTGVAKKDITSIIDALPEVIKETVANGDKVSLSGFVSFSKKHVPAKTGVTKLGGKETEWSTPEKDETSIKLSKSYKSL